MYVCHLALERKIYGLILELAQLQQSLYRDSVFFFFLHLEIFKQSVYLTLPT